MKPLTAYQGNQRFAFVCYAHNDHDKVHRDLEWLQTNDVHFWFDEGIAAGSNWRAEIGNALLPPNPSLPYC